MSRFQKHLLTVQKKFVYVGMNGDRKPIKRSKALSKFFREESTDFVYVMENENSIYFSDASTPFANMYMIV